MTEIRNRSAYHEFFIEEKLNAGMVLAGTEVKSIREGKVNFADSFCMFFKSELWIRNLHIAEYRFGTTNNHLLHMTVNAAQPEELRKRKQLKDKGYTIIPCVFF